MKERISTKVKITKPIDKTKEETLDLNSLKSLIDFIQKNESSKELEDLLCIYIKDLVKNKLGEDTELIFLFDPNGSINESTLDKIYNSITKKDLSNKTLLLFIHSGGGSIIPAYFISKQCKDLSKKFQVVVPRIAKSAATLISLGADEIHMGNISHLGPIDPQIGGLPVLGLSNAVKYLASLCAEYPESSEMIAKYMSYKLDLGKLGYFERVAESAEQYAQRLLENKGINIERAKEIAHQLVYLYKDHGFAIDYNEAKKHLGETIKVNTEEYQIADNIYKVLEKIEWVYNIIDKKNFSIIGSLEDGIRFNPITEK